MRLVNDTERIPLPIVPQLRDEYLEQPHPQRLSPRHPRFAEIMARHSERRRSGEPDYDGSRHRAQRVHRGVPRRAWILLRQRVPALSVRDRLNYRPRPWQPIESPNCAFRNPKSFQLKQVRPRRQARLAQGSGHRRAANT